MLTRYSSDLYYYSKNYEWAYITLDDALGLVSIYSSFGTFAYVWLPKNRGCDLLSFLSKLNFDYFMGKITSGRYMEDDFESMASDIQRTILVHRRRKIMTRNDARWNFSILNDAASCRSRGDWQILTSDLTDDLVPDPMDIRERPKQLLVNFWDEIWQPFLADLRSAEIAELERVA